MKNAPGAPSGKGRARRAFTTYYLPTVACDCKHSNFLSSFFNSWEELNVSVVLGMVAKLQKKSKNQGGVTKLCKH